MAKNMFLSSKACCIFLPKGQPGVMFFRGCPRIIVVGPMWELISTNGSLFVATCRMSSEQYRREKIANVNQILDPCVGYVRRCHFGS